MLLFGLAGLTLGVAILAAGVTTTIRGETASRGQREPSHLARARSTFGRWLERAQASKAALAGWMDIRMLLLGSLLPDAIDKPLGMLLSDSLSYGRIYTHTLILPGVFGSLALFVYRRYSRTWLLALAAGTGAHLVLDSMWQSPEILFWPANSLALEKTVVDLSQWAQGRLDGLLRNPAVYVPELIGVVVMARLLWDLLRRGKLATFLRRGQI